MGCFPTCFGHWSHKETIKNVPDQCLSPSHEAAKLLPATNELLKEEEIVSTKKMESESEDKCEQQANQADDSNKKKCTDEDTNTKDDDDNLVEKEMEKDEYNGSESNLSNSTNFKIRDFLITDKECAAVKPKEVTLEHCPVQQESSESLFSLSIESRKLVFAAETGDKEVTSAFKMKSTQLKNDEDKENAPLSKDPISKKSFNEAKPTNDPHLAVETSLSSWLVESEKSLKDTSTGNSPESEKNYGEREILGAITSHVELKELNKLSSGGSTPCCSADDQLAIGTVGKYWRRRGQAGEIQGPASGSSCRGVSSICT